MPPERRALSVAVVAWDLGHNAFGRAHLLADLLGADHDVAIVGSQFPEFGRDLWAPFRDTPIRVRQYRGEAFPRYFKTMERMAQELAADVVYVVKPRLPALGVGLLAKAADGRPLLVDADDHELGFVGASHGLTLGALTGLRHHPDFLRPHGRTWTAFSEWAVRFADGVTVANAPLAARYGGAVVPHARNERLFDPKRYDRNEERARLGLGPADRAVLFAGTPRRHKGIHRVVAALERIGDRRNRLCVPATPELEQLRPALGDLARWVQPVPPPPFTELPRLLAAADLACVLQDVADEAARWQTPAKVTDALAMAVPCVATATPPLLPLADEGALIPVSPEIDLAVQLQELLDDPGVRAEQGRRGREVFLRRFSYSAVRPVLERALRQAVAGARPPAADLAATVAFQRSVFGPSTASAPVPTDTRRREVDDVHAAVASAVPSGGGPVIVVSRGDEELVRFDDHVGWHFPRSEDGGYAGYYPEDSDAAIRHLEELRRSGARYLVIPASSSWWLDHYAGFREHLAASYRRLDAGTGVGTLVELVPGGAA